MTKLPESPCRIGGGTSAIIHAREARKLPSSGFKGAVLKPVARWGAGIIEKRQRVWLSNSDEKEDENEAGVYDTSRRRFRASDGVTNFKPLLEMEDGFEASFLNSHSEAGIVDVLGKRTYNDKLEQSKRTYGGSRTLVEDGFFGFSGGGDGAAKAEKQGGQIHRGTLNARYAKSRRKLFEKVLTRSDVGKLNRLVIPKQHAEKHFPNPLGSGNTLNGILLNFKDAESKVWWFRYSFWNSNHSYVLTKGWSRFVKENNLRAGNVVSFIRSTGPDKQLYVHCRKAAGNDAAAEAIGFSDRVRMVRLFGVNISEVLPRNDGDAVIDGCSRKRMGRMEPVGFGSSKRTEGEEKKAGLGWRLRQWPTNLF